MIEAGSAARVHVAKHNSTILIKHVLPGVHILKCELQQSLKKYPYPMQSECLCAHLRVRVLTFVLTYSEDVVRAALKRRKFVFFKIIKHSAAGISRSYSCASSEKDIAAPKLRVAAWHKQIIVQCRQAGLVLNSEGCVRRNDGDGC